MVSALGPRERRAWASAGRAAVWAAALWALGCASTPAVVPEEEPVQPPLTYEEELRRALEVTSDQPIKMLRYSPVKCVCPAFEVRVGLYWLRVELEALDKTTSGSSRLLSRAQNDEAAGQPREYATRGDLSTKLKRCGPGTLYAEYELETFEQ